MPDPNTNDGERNDAGDRRPGDSVREVAPGVDHPPVVDSFALISAIPGIHILCAPDAPRFTVLAVSDEVLVLSGHTRAHLLGRGYTEAFHAASSANGASVADAEPRTEALIAAVATRAPQEIRQRRRDIVHPDGEREERYWRTVTTPVFAPDGSIAALHIRAEDVTTKVLGDVPIARAAERADHILQRISDAYIVLDRDFRFVAVNAAAERSMQKTREELLGRCHWEVFPASYDIPAGQGYRRAAQEGVPQHFTQHYRWEGYDVHLEMDAYPAGDGGVAVFWRDVTARVKAEQGLRASEERYALAASATNNAIWDWDLVTDRIAWSPGLSTVFGYDASLVETSGQ